MALKTFTMLCKHHQYLYPVLFHYPQHYFHYPQLCTQEQITSASPWPWILVTSLLLSVSVNLPVLGTPHSSEIIQYQPFHVKLISLITHLCNSIFQNSIPLFLYTTFCLFHHLLTLGCFYEHWYTDICSSCCFQFFSV